MRKIFKYQVRFVTRWQSGQFLVRHDEYAKWKQYYIDQRNRARLDPALTDNQRKEIVEACEAFEWLPNRTVLVREKI